MNPDVRAWLEALGMGGYAEAFIANDITPDILQDLNESDLERLGVSLGHRKRLMRAIDAPRETNPQAAFPKQAVPHQCAMRPAFAFEPASKGNVAAPARAISEVSRSPMRQ